MKTVSDFGRKAAGEFLQSAVFIDDQIFSTVSGKPYAIQEITMPRGRKPAFSRPESNEESPDSKNPPPVETKAKADENGEPYNFHPKEIVSSFAQKGIVCALYEPLPDFKTDGNSEIFKICQAADLVVLDWDFHKDDGVKMRELVTDLVAQSSKIVPHHSRLVVIYTTTPSLTKIGSSLYDKMKAASLNPEPKDNGLRQDIGATRIVILGKTSIKRTDEEEKFTVSENALATRVIEEFVQKNMGILSSSALVAMGAIKRNSRRILAKFNPDMDGAFLLHRALLLDSDNPFETIPGLIAEELQAIIEDHFAGMPELLPVMDDSVNNLRLKAPAKQWNEDAGQNEKGNRTTKPVDEAGFQKIAKAFLLKGLNGLRDHRGCVEVKKFSENGHNITRPPDNEIIRVLREAVDPNGAATNEKLAALFNSRTYYEQQVRYLTLGTIVKTNGAKNDEYSLCIIPICDSVRLQPEKPIDFHFLHLVNGPFGKRGGNGCCVEDRDGKLIELIASPKVRSLYIEQFKAVDGVAMFVADEKSKNFVIKSETGKVYDWIGQLKPTHAQRIAHSFGQALSRVGLSEAEWVRLLCDRG